jgi:hypothetical protein
LYLFCKLGDFLTDLGRIFIFIKREIVLLFRTIRSAAWREINDGSRSPFSAELEEDLAFESVEMSLSFSRALRVLGLSSAKFFSFHYS